jgi:NAD(P)-dependent dehydrogenase (short-subunit alcohol dehydrogenase family)
MVSLKPLAEQVIVITGASSGIGLVTARQAARAGAKVVLAARNVEALKELEAEINAGRGEAYAVPTNVGDEYDVERLAQAAIQRFGRFDTWVNNAGISIFGRIMDVSTKDMRRMFETNFWGVVYGSRAAVKHFNERREPGAIVNVGSFFGDRATPVQSIYSASKFALHGFTDALRMELEADGRPVSVTLIHPGRIDTPYNEHARSYMKHQPAHHGMIYAPEAVADAILFAASHPKRDMFVGSQAKVAAVIGGIAPRLTDLIMERIMFRNQVSTTRPSRGREDNALYEAGYGLHERGNHEGFVRGRSLYVQATKRPVMTALALLGAGIAATAMMRSRSGSSRRQAQHWQPQPERVPERHSEHYPRPQRDPQPRATERPTVTNTPAPAAAQARPVSPRRNGPDASAVATASPTGVSHV